MPRTIDWGSKWRRGSPAADCAAAGLEMWFIRPYRVTSLAPDTRTRATRFARRQSGPGHEGYTPAYRQAPQEFMKRGSGCSRGGEGERPSGRGCEGTAAAEVHPPPSSSLPLQFRLFQRHRADVL